MNDESSQPEGDWPPSIAAAATPVLEQDQKRQRRVNLVRLLGHGTALLPVCAFLFMRFWLGFGIENANEDLIGPAWYIRWGGYQTSMVLLPVCLIGGIASIVFGFLMRQWLAFWEGIWVCVSVPVLFILFMIAMS